MSTAARKRLMRDFKRLQQDPPEGVNASPLPDSIMRWNAVIFGPEGTLWDGAILRLSLDFSEEFPNKPPTVRFLTPLFHPNVYADGAICLDVLQNQWSPIYDVAAVLTSVQSLLPDPNPASPANAEAARLFVDDRRGYNARVRACVEATWVDDGAGEAGTGDEEEGEEEAAGEGGAAAGVPGG